MIMEAHLWRFVRLSTFMPLLEHFVDKGFRRETDSEVYESEQFLCAAEHRQTSIVKT